MNAFTDLLKEKLKLNESRLDIGDWYTQPLGDNSDREVWGVVIAKQKNGSLKGVTFTSYSGSMTGNAKIESIGNWHPAPTSIEKAKVPHKAQQKIMTKANKYL